MRVKSIRFLSMLAVAIMSVVPASATTLFGDVQHVDALPVSDGDHINAMIKRQTNLLVPQQATMAPQPAPPLRGEAASQAPLQGNASGVAPLQGQATLARPAVVWFMIPRWMAGQWHKQGDLTVSVTDLLSGRSGVPNVWTDNEMTVTWGHQLDRAGNVWHANFIPIERDGESDGDIVRFVTVAQKCEFDSPEQLVTRTHYVVTKSMERFNRIVERFQQETLNDYTALSTGELANTSSNKMFHMNGQPYRVGKLQSKFTKTADFAPLAMDRGVDLRRALVDYLRAKHLDDLVPDQLSMNE